MRYSAAFCAPLLFACLAPALAQVAPDPNAPAAPSLAELKEAAATCQTHRNAPPPPAAQAGSALPKSLPPNVDYGFAPGWESCAKVKAALDAAMAADRAASDQQKINGLVKRLGQ